MTIDEQIEPCTHPDFDWFNPNPFSDDDMDEVLACTVCGHVKWTARDVAKKDAGDERLLCAVLLEKGEPN